MTNNNYEKVMDDLHELVKIQGSHSRTLRKLEDILDDEVRFNSFNLRKRGEYDAYAISQKVAYGVPGSSDSYRLYQLARTMIAHNIGYVISDMLASYTRTQEYISCGYYTMGSAFYAKGTIDGAKIA